VLICPDGDVEIEMLNHVLPYNYQKMYMQTAAPALVEQNPELSVPMTQEDIVELEKEAIINALEECNNVQAKAAKKLGMTARQIGYKIKKYNL
ncbi:MAG TPA: nif-specific transcriptional activator NifA, partial [Epsilonproteobacteria bacterium]|nr:nif-specific transcriptional activator NifA [Campylobacterota bacterium]